MEKPDDENEIFQDVDELLDRVGVHGRFQALLVCLFALTIIATMFNPMMTYFVALDPSWKCTQGNSSCKLNGTMKSHDARRCALPRQDWEYTQSTDYSIVTRFDLHCGNEWLVHLSTGVMFLTWGPSCIMAGWLADKYGRRTIIIPSVLTTVVLSALISLSPHVAVFITCRALIGLFVYGGSVLPVICMSEFVTTKYRPLFVNITTSCIPLSLCILALKAYFIRKWRTLMLVCSVPYLIVVALLLLFLPESVNWLYVHNHLDDMRKVVEKMARWNNKKLPNNISLPSHIATGELRNLATGELRNLATDETCNMANGKPGKVITKESSNLATGELRNLATGEFRNLATGVTVESSNLQSVKSSNVETGETNNIATVTSRFKDLFTPRIMLQKTMIIGYAWFAVGLVHYGLILAASDLAGSLYLNFFLINVIDLPGHAVSAYCATKYGRKRSVCGFFLIAGVSCAAIMSIPTEGTVKVTCAIVGKLFIVSSFTGLYVWSLEIYPTQIRAQAIGFSQLMSRIGAFASPWVAKGFRSFHTGLPFLFMGCAALLAGFMLLLLTETTDVVTREINLETGRVNKGVVNEE